MGMNYCFQASHLLCLPINPWLRKKDQKSNLSDLGNRVMGGMKSKFNVLSLINFNWWRVRSAAGHDGITTPVGTRVHFDTSDVKMYSWDLRPKQQSHRISRKENEEIVLGPNSINGAQVTVENCRNCRIYLLDYSAALTIDDCQDTIIISGPVKGSVFLRDTSNSTLCVVAGQLRVRDCNEIHIFGGAESEPIIEASGNVTIGPYALNYDGIGDQFKLALLYPDKLVTTTIYDFTPPAGDGQLNWKTHSGPSTSKYLPIPTQFVPPGFSTEEAKSYVNEYVNRLKKN